ncbi:MAG TPA: hypothetical protein VMA83_10365 [Solirubrobacteraceae bacterium]|nr:hypothetical protein [Solirubrobacteraceae bacterium]
MPAREVTIAAGCTVDDAVCEVALLGRNRPITFPLRFTPSETTDNDERGEHDDR